VHLGQKYIPDLSGSDNQVGGIPMKVCCVCNTLVLQLSFFLATNVFGFQHESHSQQVVANRVVVDGGKTPQLISDETALRAMFLALTEPKNGNQTEIARLRAKVAQIGLLSEDASIMMTIMTDFHAPSQQLMQQLRDALSRKNGGSDSDTYQKAYSGLSHLVNVSYADLISRLSPDGRSKLIRYVQYVKTRIRIIPPPNMAQ
jgi:hypothetical protein